MGDLFDIWQNHRQDQDIESLKTELGSMPDHTTTIIRLQGRVQRLELVVETLVEAMVIKEVATREQLDVLMAQVDLRDGLENGALNSERRDAPTCGTCGRYVNPQREACVYCGAAVMRPEKKVAPVRLVRCAACGDEIAERESFFASDGLRCSSCFEY